MKPRAELRLLERDTNVRERDWERLVDQLRRGHCLPFIGAGACYGVLPTARELARYWADRCEYPFPDRDNLARVIQYDTVNEEDVVTVKERVFAYLQDQLHNRLPDFTASTQPHALLARQPIPLYITTNYDDILQVALQRAGRRPVTAICRWAREGVGRSAGRPMDDLSPRPDTPVVFHLHGAGTDPKSLVLTEEDYLEFLVNLVIDKGADDQNIIPNPVLEALATRPMLFIGYSLQDWTFQVLFHGLKRTIGRSQRRRHLSVQLRIDNADATAKARAEDYLKKQLDDWDITVYWGTAEQFCTELADRLGAAQ
jgi:hypothetical protein